ncbi:MAG TPA: alpha-hydroxy acid oxidase [Xanthobacteraceae bacterium]|nr:alpha-hydroxy acid oxidase [Xanthobacteraceae bacterium]
MNIATISDLRAPAKRRLPSFVFDYLDGGAGTEAGMHRNTAAFDEIRFKPRMLVNIEKRDLSTNLFGRRWSLPFGTAPIGFCNLMCPGAEQAIAQAALEAGIPCTLSTAGTTALEDYVRFAPQNAWFQLYVSRFDNITHDIIDRADRSGYETLVVTVDIPLAARRPRDLRNNFSVALKISPKFVWELVSHPTWSFATLSAGIPKFETMQRYMEAAGTKAVAGFVSSQVSGSFDWDALKRLRDGWKRRFVVKGLLSAEDAVRARDLGCDGIVISNHGGRQLDSLPAPIEVVSEIRAAVGEKFPLILDSGIRSGEHIAKALAAGADFCLVGRAVMYAVSALGKRGAKVAIDLLADEISRTLAQIGYTDIGSLKAASPLIRPH